MFTLYKVKYNQFAASMGLESSAGNETWYTFEPGSRYLEIVESIPVKYEITFKLSYRGTVEYNVRGLNDKDGFNTIHILAMRETYAGGHWNYTESDFERQVNGALYIAYTRPGEFIDPELLKVFQMIEPRAVAGRYDTEIHGWIKQDKCH